jgi:hypothetical protein
MLCKIKGEELLASDIFMEKGSTCSTELVHFPGHYPTAVPPF